MQTIQFNELSAILLDYVDGARSDGGFLYLRMVGDEPTVNAIWSRLSAREYRAKKYSTEVQVPVSGRQYPEYVAAQKVVYKTLRARLPSGLVDLAMIHPALTVSADTERGFFLLTYEIDAPPASFFPRLNKTLSIPLQPEWAAWLWEEGQQAQTWLTVETEEELQDGETVERERLVQTSQTPIRRYDSRGQVSCYLIQTGGLYKAAWLQIIREQLSLGIPLYPAQMGAEQGYQHSPWSIFARSAEQWMLACQDEVLLTAPSLEFLLAKARDKLGRHFLIQRRA